MKIRIQNSGITAEAREGESLLLSFARLGIILSAPCGGRGHCGKCMVRVLEGQVTADICDESGWVRACRAIPISDLVIACPENYVLGGNEVSCNIPHKGKVLVRAAVALDIGTTTVSAKLIDLDTEGPTRASVVIDTISELNDQRVFGADVMSRIGMARQGRTAELFALINRQAERILESFRKRWDIRQIERLSVSGNTTMLHLFLNVDPSGMGEAPFTPVFLNEREVTGESLSLSVDRVIILPSISAFVGGDITAGLAVLDILHSSGPSLLIDIGTNGEMALFNSGKILCSSAAAGPCFEGAEITNGMGGIRGAISGVELVDSGIQITTIGNVTPRGICGSGLIDAVAVMLKQGIVDETGFMDYDPEGYTLAPGVSIINRDIRQFQLAKSAILSGIRILCRNGGLDPGDVENVYIAGGLGFFINRENAVVSGLFPKEFLEKITVSGNLSLQGAEETITSKEFLEKCKKIISCCSVIDLSKDPAFMDEFAENMMF